MANRLRFWFAFGALLVLGALATACSSTPLPPLFRPASAVATQASPAQPVAQPVAAATVEATAPATTVITATPESALPAAEPTVAATSPQVEETQLPTPTATPTEVAPTPTPTQIPATATPLPQVQAKPTARPTRAVVRATATRAPTRAAARPAPTQVRPTPTPEWPKTLAITAQQLEEQAGSVPGLTVTGLDVTFADNSMTLSAQSLRYSIVSIRNLVVQGHFTASNCDVTFVADSIQPRNLATASIPNIVNQSLDQQLGQWCVESIAIVPGQLVATVRPR